jgi:hypothetical protein
MASKIITMTDLGCLSHATTDPTISVEELSVWLNQQIAQASTYPEKCAFMKVLNKLTK